MNGKELKRAVDSISVTSENQARIMEKIINSKEIKGDKIIKEILSPEGIKEDKKMIQKKKISILALAAVLLLGVTALAAGGVITSWYSTSKSTDDYTKLPTKEQCRKDVGYDPVLIEHFDNGYFFKEGSVVSNKLEDNEGKTAETFKSLDFTYEKDGDEVMLSQERYKSDVPQSGHVAGQVGGKKLYYYSYKNKFVPPDYQLTEEDKKAEKAGTLVFSYGSDQVEVITVQSLSWDDGDMHYGLMQMDGRLSEKELTEMAKEIIKADR